MPAFDTFTKRKRRAEGGKRPDVYRYDDVPRELRVQVLYLWRDALGGYREMGPYDFSGAPPIQQAMRDNPGRGSSGAGCALSQREGR